MELTSQQREITGAVVETVNEVDWNGDITPYIDRIVSVIGELIAQDPEFAEFARAIYDQSARWSLAAWSEQLVPNLGDSGWSKLCTRLEAFFPAD